MPEHLNTLDLNLLIRNIDQQSIFHIYCICHVATLCAADAHKAISKFVEQLCRDIHKHFVHCTKSLQRYHEYSEFIEINKLKISHLY